jgi:hypothetical protein
MTREIKIFSIFFIYPSAIKIPALSIRDNQILLPIILGQVGSFLPCNTYLFSPDHGFTDSFVVFEQLQASRINPQKKAKE